MGNMFKKSLNVFDTLFGFYIHFKKVTFGLSYGHRRRKWVKPNTDDYKVFSQTIVSKEAPLWDREKVRLHADVFYHSYFQDFQLMSDLKQKAQSRIQSFNIRVTRQDDKNDQSSSQANKQRLEAKFRKALHQMYKAFGEAYTLQQPELIEDLRDHLVKPAIAQITSLFVSSRCRTCYGENTKLQPEDGAVLTPLRRFSAKYLMKPTKRLKTT